MALQQPGSPVAIVSDTNTAAGGAFAEVTIKNIDRRAIKSVTLGVLVHRPDLKRSPDLRTGTPTAVDLQPGKTILVTTDLLPMTVVGTLAKEGTSVVAEVGVLNVSFADNSAWQFDVKKYGRFSVDEIRAH
jgi:hypothetical protein